MVLIFLTGLQGFHDLQDHLVNLENPVILSNNILYQFPQAQLRNFALLSGSYLQLRYRGVLEPLAQG
jgi:hypothetical protein